MVSLLSSVSRSFSIPPSCLSSLSLSSPHSFSHSHTVFLYLIPSLSFSLFLTLTLALSPPLSLLSHYLSLCLSLCSFYSIRIKLRLFMSPSQPDLLIGNFIANQLLKINDLQSTRSSTLVGFYWSGEVDIGHICKLFISSILERGFVFANFTWPAEEQYRTIHPCEKI